MRPPSFPGVGPVRGSLGEPGDGAEAGAEDARGRKIDPAARLDERCSQRGVLAPHHGQRDPSLVRDPLGEAQASRAAIERDVLLDEEGRADGPRPEADGYALGGVLEHRVLEPERRGLPVRAEGHALVLTRVAPRGEFIRLFPREYQAIYLEGLIAAALTGTGNVGIVSAFPNVQVLRRQAGFVLGVQDGANTLGKRVNIYIKYVGGWYKPAEEREIATTLVSQSNVDVITQQTDSRSPLDVAGERKIWYVGKDMDVVGFYGWSSTDTVAVSFDTRWEVLYDRMVKDWIAGNRNPRNILYLGMKDTMTLADGTVEAAVDIMNNKKLGVDAISPKAKSLIPGSILKLVTERREQMMKGQWDPFQVHALVSNGTGLALKGTPIPAKGMVVKKAGQMPPDEWLLGKFNFDLDGVTILK